MRQPISPSQGAPSLGSPLNILLMVLFLPLVGGGASGPSPEILSDTAWSESRPRDRGLALLRRFRGNQTYAGVKESSLFEGVLR